MILMLKNVHTGSLHYLLSDAEKDYTIGRKDCDILIADDQSISRKHAIIKVGDTFATLKDNNSKYKTFHQSAALPSNEERQLKNDDIVKFGAYSSVYEIQTIFIVTTGSHLTNTEKTKLKSIMNNDLKGQYVDTWTSDCTHLTLKQIILTVKMLHALIDNKYYVTMDYWTSYVDKIKNQLPLPCATDFKPPMAEILLNQVDLVPDARRKTLFAKKTFVFPTEQMRAQMSEIIAKAGGESIASWQSKPSAILAKAINSPDTFIFIRHDDDDGVTRPLDAPSRPFTLVHELMLKTGQRLVPVQEIAMALAHCSCEQNCNPLFRRVEAVFNNHHRGDGVLSAGGEGVAAAALALETQSQDFLMSSSVMMTRDDLVIPASAESDLDLVSYPARINKRQLSDDDDDGSIHHGDSLTKRVKHEDKVEIVEEPLKIDVKMIHPAADIVKTETNIFMECRGDRKRKAVNDDDDSNTTSMNTTNSRKCLRNNPFAALTIASNKQKDVSKPVPSRATTFELNRSVAVSSSSFAIPSTSNQATRNLMSSSLSTSTNNKKDKQLSSSRSIIKVETAVNNNNSVIMNNNMETTSRSLVSSWLSKSVTGSSSSIGNVNNNNNMMVNADREMLLMNEEMRLFCKKFENAVVTERLPLSMLIVNGNITNSGSNVGSIVKSFKKFQKILPLKPQTSVVQTLSRFVAGENN